MRHKLIILIILLAAFLRFYKLGSYPVSLSWDEVAIGYNAFSIARTASDEYGKKWPILFKSFNDFKLPGYIYLDSLFIKTFGLSEFTVRLPSALMGILAVLTLYILTQKLLGDKVAIFAAFFLTISPWHLQLSRAAFEANLSLTIILLGVLLLFYGPINKLAAFLSIPILAFSVYFYYSPRIFVPVILITFIFLFKKEISINIKYYFLGFILTLAILFPLIFQISSAEGLKRVREVSIFQDQSLIIDYVEAKAKNPNFASSLLLNRRIPLTFEALNNYFSHFSFGFLFFGDDPNPRHHSAFHGNLYIFEIPLVLLGLWLLLKFDKSRVRYFILTWLLLGPVTAAFAKESPHSLRSLLMLPPIIMVNSLALANLAKRGDLLKKIIFVIIIIFVINYLYSYYLIYPLKNSSSWAYGYKQMFSEVSKMGDKYDRIIVTGYYWKPYIFYLFYNQFDPRTYQNGNTQESIGKYRFGTTGWDSGGKDFEDGDLDRLKGQKTLVAISIPELEGLKNKDRFIPILTVKDYAGKNTVFVIGDWL